MAKRRANKNNNNNPNSSNRQGLALTSSKMSTTTATRNGRIVRGVRGGIGSAASSSSLANSSPLHGMNPRHNNGSSSSSAFFVESEQQRHELKQGLEENIVEKNLQQLHQMITLSFQKSGGNWIEFDGNISTINDWESHDNSTIATSEIITTGSENRMIDCRKFYELVYQLIKYQNATDLVYDTYRRCAVDCFRKFAKHLIESSTSTSTTVDDSSTQTTNVNVVQNNSRLTNLIMTNVNLIRFSKSIFETILPSVGFAFVYPERLLLKSSTLMLIYELTCHHFATEVIQIDTVRDAILSIYLHYIDEMRVLFKRHLLEQLSSQTKPENIEKIVQSSFQCLTGESSSVLPSGAATFFLGGNQSTITNFPVLLCSNLTKMLFELDEKNLSIFYRVVELPLIQQTVQYSNELADELIGVHQLSMLDYVTMLDTMIQLNCHLLEQFGFPPDSVANIRSILGHTLLANKMNEIVFVNRTSFQSLFQSGELSHANQTSLLEATKLYRQVMAVQSHNIGANDKTSTTESTAEPEPNCQQFLLFIDQHLRSVFVSFVKRFDFKKRSNSLEFVGAAVKTLENLDFICSTVFQLNKTIDARITTFYNQLLTFNDRIPQALAYYLHDICMKDSTVLPNRPSMKSLIERLPEPEINEEEAKRCAALSKLIEPFFELIPYMRDHNDLFDYSKHYFCQRLLMNNAVEYSIPKQMIMFDELTGHIKALFGRHGDIAVTNSKCYFSNAATVARIQKNQTKPNYYQFSQNLQDFHTIQNDFNNSENFFQNFFVRPQPPPVVAAPPSGTAELSASLPVELNQCKILHAGIWKMVDFDQCRIPRSIYGSWKEFAAYYSTHISMKKLLLNTKHSKALVEFNLGTDKPQVSKRPTIQLLVSLHQLAILWCFERQNHRTYDQLKQQTKFQKEANLQVSLLSLVYSGLLFASLRQPKQHQQQGGAKFSDLEFELNENFHSKSSSKTSSNSSGPSEQQPIDISLQEYVNFWQPIVPPTTTSTDDDELDEDLDVDRKYQAASIGKLIARICPNKDLMFENSCDSVQDVNQIQRILSSNSGNVDGKKLFSTPDRTSTGGGSGTGTSTGGSGTPTASGSSSILRPSNKTSKTNNVDDGKFNNRSSGTSLLNNNQTSLSKFNTGSGSHTSGSTTSGSSGGNSSDIDITSVDNLIKVECAIVRLLKRSSQPSVLVINRKLKEMLHNKPGYTVELIDQISYELTVKVVQGLVDKKYVRQDPNGQYCFIIN